MAISCTHLEDGIAVITMHNPPVNAVTVADTRALGEVFHAVGADDGVRAVVLHAVGRGFHAGLDRRELQTGDRFRPLLASAAASAALLDHVRRTPVPVVAAVHDFCMGLGVGLVASCDIVVASTAARFGLPDIDDEAVGCAPHLARLVPPFRLRQMVFTCETVSAELLHSWGTVHRVCEPQELAGVALTVARTIARKPSRVVRAAKLGLDAIDGRNWAREHRFVQGVDHELALWDDESRALDEPAARSKVVFE